MPGTDEAELLARLEQDALIHRVGAAFRTTRRWQSAMMRAAARLYSAGDPGGDIRVPVALALVDLYGIDAPDEELTALVAVMAPIEARELSGEIPSSSPSPRAIARK